MWGGKFPYQVKVQLVIPQVTDVPKKVLAEFGINPATGRFDNCVDEDLAEDLIRAMLGKPGMAVQTGHFKESRGESVAHQVTFYGQEFKTSNLRLAKMNLAVHGLEGNVVEANTFYTDAHELLGKRVMWTR